MANDYDPKKVEILLKKIRNKISEYDLQVNKIEQGLPDEIDLSPEMIKQIELTLEDKLKNHQELKNSVSRDMIHNAERSRNSARLKTLKKLLF